MANLIKEHNSQFNIGCARDLNYLDSQSKEDKGQFQRTPPLSMKLQKERQKANQFPAVPLFSFSGKKILMAEEPSENPEHLSFKEKLKRFQNKEATPSGSVKVITVFNICLDLKQVSCFVFFLISFLFFVFFYKLNCISDIFQKL